MAEVSNAVIGTVEYEHRPVATPNPAQIIDTDIPHRRYAVAVTEGSGLEVKALDEHAEGPFPYRAKGTRQVSEVTALLDELTRRPLTPGQSTLWGDYTTGTVVAVYNDHTTEIAGWRDDLCTLQVVKDPDWSAWEKLSGKFLSQGDFGDLIEELLHTVVVPDQADLYEIINSVRASSSSQFESNIDRSDGSQTLTYTKEVSASAGRATRKLEVPKTITLRLRPWEGHIETYDVEAWFRLRVDNGNLGLAVKLKPTQQILRRAWADLTAKVVEHTSIPVLAYRGTR